MSTRRPESQRRYSESNHFIQGSWTRVRTETTLRLPHIRKDARNITRRYGLSMCYPLTNLKINSSPALHLTLASSFHAYSDVPPADHARQMRRP